MVEVVVDRAVQGGEFSTRLSGQRPASRLSMAFRAFNAAPYDALVTDGEPEIVLHGNRIAGRNPSRIAIVIFAKTSSRCQRRCRKFRIVSTRLRRISAAKMVPNRGHQIRIVSCVTSMPRPCGRSSMFRSESG
ncbi:MAG: hypothetical protein O9308_14440 [Beijerinckiaceae bacterium]|nr:hypothetical protein [Beijerinckiaceae bacterium]